MLSLFPLDSFVRVIDTLIAPFLFVTLSFCFFLSLFFFLVTERGRGIEHELKWTGKGKNNWENEQSIEVSRRERERGRKVLFVPLEPNLPLF